MNKPLEYLIIGAGPAGVTAAETLRVKDPKGKITLLSGESSYPYSRMALPFYLMDRIAEDSLLIRRDKAAFNKMGIDYRNNSPVARLNCQEQLVEVEDGKIFKYDKLGHCFPFDLL